MPASKLPSASMNPDSYRDEKKSWHFAGSFRQKQHTEEGLQKCSGRQKV